MVVIDKLVVQFQRIKAAAELTEVGGGMIIAVREQ